MNKINRAPNIKKKQLIIKCHIECYANLNSNYVKSNDLLKNYADLAPVKVTIDKNNIHKPKETNDKICFSVIIYYTNKVMLPLVK